jgi:glycosyltransferase involved in cell wall biosynthesis
MKGILLIRESPKYSMGGIQGKVLSIAKHLKEQGRYLPILGTSDADSLFSNEFKKLGLSVYELPMRERKGIKKSVEIFENYILKEHDVHIIQSHNFRESITGRAIRKKHPELKHIFRVHTHIDGGTISSVRKIFYRILDGITSKEVDVFVPISVTVEKELLTKSRIPKEKIRVLFNGIPPLGPPDPPDRSEAGLKREIAIAGDLQKRKNQAMAVESIAMLRDKGIYVKLHLIGGDREGYKKMIMDVAKLHAVTDQVHMHGYKKRSEIYDIIKDVPVIVLPSLFEGMPTSIIEGMSLRKIVVDTCWRHRRIN